MKPIVTILIIVILVLGLVAGGIYGKKFYDKKLNEEREKGAVIAIGQMLQLISTCEPVPVQIDENTQITLTALECMGGTQWAE